MVPDRGRHHHPKGLCRMPDVPARFLRLSGVAQDLPAVPRAVQMTGPTVPPETAPACALPGRDLDALLCGSTDARWLSTPALRCSSQPVATRSAFLSTAKAGSLQRRTRCEIWRPLMVPFMAELAATSTVSQRAGCAGYI